MNRKPKKKDSNKPFGSASLGLSSRRRQDKKYRILGFVFLGIGIAGLAMPLIQFTFVRDYFFLDSLAKARSASSPRPDLGTKAGQADIRYDESSIAVTAPAGSETARASEDTLTDPSASSGQDANFNYREHRDIPNRLVIPSAKVDMPVFDGEDADLLLKGGWLFPHTSTPDKGGNTVVFGHRVRYLPPITNTFYALDKTQPGEEFTLAWRGTVYTYKVIDIKTIEPTDLSVLHQTDTPQITLVTCAPLFTAKQRLVVIGELVE